MQAQSCQAHLLSSSLCHLLLLLTLHLPHLALHEGLSLYRELHIHLPAPGLALLRSLLQALEEDDLPRVGQLLEGKFEGVATEGVATEVLKEEEPKAGEASVQETGKDTVEEEAVEAVEGWSMQQVGRPRMRLGVMGLAAGSAGRKAQILQKPQLLNTLS